MAGLNLALPGGGGFGLNLGGMPPLGFSSSASSGMDMSGGQWSASGNGDWVVNLGGSGFAAQSGATGLNWVLIAVALGAAWYLTQR